jgi:hypothetical protein
MTLRLTPTRLRAELYKTLDRVLETGEPVEVDRRGQRVLMVRERNASRISRLLKHPGTISGDPDDLPGLTWEDAWRAGQD